MSVRVDYLKLRRVLLPWCMRPGCWKHSYVSNKGRRGNLCPVHAWEAIQTALNDEAFDE